MKKIRLLTTKLGSQSLKKLAVALQAKLGYKVWRSSKPKPNRLGLLYGQGKDKITQYQFFEKEGIPAPPFTTTHTQASTWVGEGKTVVCRKLINSSEGKGIVVA